MKKYILKSNYLPKIIAASLGLAYCGSSMASDSNDMQHFNISPSTMGEALKVFAIESGSEILFSPSLVKGKNTDGLSGDYTRQQALKIILSGTDLVAQNNEGKVFLIVPEEEKDTSSKSSNYSNDLVMDSSGKKSYRNSVIEEVTVTANKREQNLQDVAMGLSALTGDDLNRIGAVGAEDYLAQIPGVNYNSLGRGRSPIIIRGISTSSTTINGNPPTN